MDHRIHAQFHRVVEAQGPRTGRVLEVGGLVGKSSLLRFPELAETERTLINLSQKASKGGVRAVQGNSNDMREFADESFDLVMSNAVLEHDKYFWKSIGEMKRILKPSGLMIIGVPGFVELPTDTGQTTTTFKVHFSVDYYRYSLQAVHEVFFENMDRVEHEVMLRPPRIIAWGCKPNSPRRGAGVLARARRWGQGSRGAADQAGLVSLGH